MRWSDGDIDFLLKNYTIKNTLELSIELNRTVRSIEAKIKKLGKSLNDRKWEIIFCKNCNKEVKSLKSDNRKFCSKTCSTTFNNKGRIVSDNERTIKSSLMSGKPSPFKKERPLCKTCGKECKKLENIYCSKECVWEDEDYRQKHSDRMKKRLKDFPEMHPNRLCAGIKESFPEKFLTDYLIMSGLIKNIDFIKQYNIDVYYVDFYFPKSNIIIEVDGERWHDSKCPKEIIREDKLKENYILYRFKVKKLLKKDYTEIIKSIIEKSK